MTLRKPNHYKIVMGYFNVIMGKRKTMETATGKFWLELRNETGDTKRPPRVDAAQIGYQKIEFQLELRNRFETLQEQNDIDTMNETITDMIQKSASRVAKVINKPLESRISSPNTSPDDETTKHCGKRRR